MTGEQWLRGSVPRAYAAQTLRAAEETLQEEAQTIQEQRVEGTTELQTSLLGRTQAISRTLGQMRAAVEGDDKQSLAQLLEQLGGEEQAIRSLAGGARP